jgi:ATP-binding cassette, subfamily B, bacterial MsbA
LIAYFIGLFTISFKLTMITILILPLSGGIISYVARQLKRRARQSQETLGRLNTILDEVLSGMRIVKAFNANKQVSNHFEKEVHNYARFTFSMQRKFALASPISEFLGIFVVAAIILIGGNMILQGSDALNASKFITFVAIFSQVLNPAKALSNSFSSLQRGIAAGERVFSITEQEPAIQNKPHAQTMDKFERSIRYEGVHFAYDEEEVLKGIDLTINKGEMVALVGPSGGGKSTLADLLPRFYDPTKGVIKIDSIALTDYTVESIRAHMGIVAQESILFNDTIFNNIAFGQENATLEQVIEAARIANALEFIEQLEEGFETTIGERGTKLSGGQRQRISIARAVLKNPEILILDEATSALDSESERLVQEALQNVMKGRTSLVIAHRLSTIQKADKIVVIQGGRIVESGTHQELVEQKGLYMKLFEMQSF